MTINERVMKLVSLLAEGKQSAFAEKTDIKTGTLGDIVAGRLNKPSFDVIEKIALKHPRVNLEWLIRGNGEPLSDTVPKRQTVLPKPPEPILLKEPSVEYLSSAAVRPMVATIDSYGNENITLVNLQAAAGYLTGGFAQPEFIESLPAFYVPGFTNATFRAFEVRRDGDSMIPTVYPTDWAISSYVEDILSLKDGRVYVIVSKTEGITIKRVLNRLTSKGKGYLLCQSDNPIYAPFKMLPEDILEVWSPYAKLSYQFPPPDRTEQRLTELEMRYADLMHMMERTLKRPPLEEEGEAIEV